MANASNDKKKWADGVETYPATAQDLAVYQKSRDALSQFQAPLLVSQNNPHSRLFVASFDGTGNDKYKDPEHITNIGTLDDQVQTAVSNGVKKIGGYYVPGVGTQDDAFTRNLDGGLGYSYGPRMEKMYLEFINQASDWKKEDPQAEISIVSTGFSRGAVTAAMFTRMVHERGIQNPRDMQIDQGPNGEILKLTPIHPPLVPPGRTAQVAGLLDPVATGDMNLRDTRLPPSVVSGLQLSARDERRDMFPAKDIIDPGRTQDGRLLNLVNPGAHSDIGGSYRIDGLSVRNGDLLTDYVNTLSDTPFLQPRTVSTAPEMNVIHRSEDFLHHYHRGHPGQPRTCEGPGGYRGQPQSHRCSGPGYRLARAVSLAPGGRVAGTHRFLGAGVRAAQWCCRRAKLAAADAATPARARAQPCAAAVAGADEGRCAAGGAGSGRQAALLA